MSRNRYPIQPERTPSMFDQRYAVTVTIWAADPAEAVTIARHALNMGEHATEPAKVDVTLTA